MPVRIFAQEEGVKSYRFPGVCAVVVTLSFSIGTRAQVAPPVAATSAAGVSENAVRELQGQITELRAMMDEMRAENARSRAEMERLREDLQATRTLLEHPGSAQAPTVNAESNQTPQPETASQNSPALEDRVQKLEESSSLLSSKIDEQYQTKVETASKYRARLHGIVLMNAFRNVGAADNLDFPSYALPVAAGASSVTVGATLRQSEIGLELFGPNIAGARSSADVQLDFSGGFPKTGNGVNFGIVRLQTASLRLDWEHTSVVAGQDSLFLSPLSPTSFASLATPAFAYTGNLWGWTPQLRIEHRFNLSDVQNITVQAGVLDNLDWEFPYSTFYRSPQAGELSGQPAYALRTAWTRTVHDHPLSFGAAGYYGRQDWSWDRYVDAWAAMADWQIPLLPRLRLSGEFYRGRGIGGLGGGIGSSIVYGGDPNAPVTPIHAVDTAGGWSELKLQLTPKVELNGAIGQDDAFASGIRGFASDQDNYGSILGRNRSGLANIVYRPRSDLILSAEVRRLRTFPFYSNSSVINQLNLSMGILF
jgi:hypothetical protein